MFAAIGDDGMRPVVWGLGRTERAAIREARRWLRDEDGHLLPAEDYDALEVVAVTPEQAARITDGEVCVEELRLFTATTDVASVRRMLTGDGYDSSLAEDVLAAARKGALLWTRERLTTTDSSRIDARPTR